MKLFNYLSFTDIITIGACILVIIILVIYKMRNSGEIRTDNKTLKEKQNEPAPFMQEKQKESTPDPVYKVYSDSKLNNSNKEEIKSKEKKAADLKKQRFIKYTPEGYVAPENNKNKRIFRWR
jgi:hypothetical protein